LIVRVQRALGAAALSMLGIGPFPALAQPAAAGAADFQQTHMCGVSAASAPAFLAALGTDARLQERPGNARFQIYASADQRFSWAATRSSEPAHPAVTCREVGPDPDNGRLTITRSMRCDGPRPACEALHAEFQALDDGVRARIEQRRR